MEYHNDKTLKESREADLRSVAEHLKRIASEGKQEQLETENRLGELLRESQLRVRSLKEQNEGYAAQLADINECWTAFKLAWNTWSTLRPENEEHALKLSENVSAGIAMIDDTMGDEVPLSLDLPPNSD